MGLHYAILLLAGACAAIASVMFYPFTVDDAFIVARYAVNARDLGEWVFNAGEHVSAMTSPLHGLVLVGLSFIAADPLPIYKSLSLLVVVVAFAACLARYGLLRSDALPLVAVLAGPGIALWTFAGLETPVLTAIATTMAAIYCRDITSSDGRSDGRAQLKLRPTLRPTSRPAWLGALAGAAILTRYDAVLFAGPVLLAALMHIKTWRTRVTTVAAAALPVLAWLIYSWRRFDSILPTSFYIKTPSGSFDVISGNVGYMAEHLGATGIAVVAAYVLVGVIFSPGGGSLAAEELRTRWGLHLGIAAVLVYGTTMATVHMMFAFRHFVPYLGPAALALVHLARRVNDQQRMSTLRWAAPVTALMILTIHASHAEALYHRSLQGLGASGEYAAQGTAGYTRDFIPAMRRNAVEVRQHWERLNKGRPPRIWTFAAGALPHEYMDAYIFEELVSFRHRCPPRGEGDRPDSRQWREHADYIHAFTRHGHLNRLLAPLRARDVELVSEQQLHFNGQDEKLLVFYNNAPKPNVLPPHIEDLCLTSPKE
jgi:arabinofuranosyltransferase